MSTRFWMMRIGINQMILDNSPYADMKREKIMRKRRGKSARRKSRIDQGEKGSSADDSAESKPNEFAISDSNSESERSNKGYMDRAIETKLPFYAWECITLSLKMREIDLVIPDPEDMRVLILFLIIRLNTFDGKRNSLDVLRQRKIVPKSFSAQKMSQKIYRSFFMMKVRMKISFEACYQCRTVSELILMALLKTYHDRKRLNLIRKPYPRVTPAMVESVRHLCLQNCAKVNVLLNEAKTLK